MKNLLLKLFVLLLVSCDEDYKIPIKSIKQNDIMQYKDCTIENIEVEVGCCTQDLFITRCDGKNTVNSTWEEREGKIYVNKTNVTVYDKDKR